YLPSAAGHTHNQQMNQRGGTEYGQHRTEDQWEVDCLTEVDERRRRNGRTNNRLVDVEVVVDRCLPPWTRYDAGQDSAIGGSHDRPSARCSVGTRRTRGAFIPGDRERCSGSQAYRSCEHRKRDLRHHLEWHGSFATRL